MTWDTEKGRRINDWRRVVFSDEKKFNLDGPDGWNYYFHDLRKDEVILKRSHSRAGGVMIWAAISYYGTIDLLIQSGRIDGKTYISTLQTAFPKCCELFGGNTWIFQQDNAPIHTAKIVKEWINDQNIEVMQWPPYSPDLNIIENVWGWLARKVYEGGKQYDDIESLVESIKAAWADITLNYLGTLYNSMKDRLFEVISKNGGHTHY
jgi:hypothetical protein